jgi:hypothetical protein
MMAIAEQDAVPQSHLWAPGSCNLKPQAPQVTEMDTAHNSEALELALDIGVATFNHR